MAWCSLGNVVADDDRKTNGCWTRKGGRGERAKRQRRSDGREMHARGVGLRPGVATPTTYRHGDKFSTDPIRKRITKGWGCQAILQEVKSDVLWEKRQTSRGRVAGKKCFVSSAEMTLARNLFPCFTSLSLVVHSFRVHICLRDKGPFGPRHVSRSPLGLNLFTDACNLCKCKLKFTSNNRGERCYIKVPKKRWILTCYSELITSR